jgi:hypothetical protein
MKEWTSHDISGGDEQLRECRLGSEEDELFISNEATTTD